MSALISTLMIGNSVPTLDGFLLSIRNTIEYFTFLRHIMK